MTTYATIENMERARAEGIRYFMAPPGWMMLDDTGESMILVTRGTFYLDALTGKEI